MAEPSVERKDEIPEVMANDAQRGLPELLGRVQYGSERFRITKNGKEAAALVTIRDLERLLALDGAA